MPTFFERILDSLGASSLDDKAKFALNQLDGVNAVSILSKLESRGDEVRNPSAFVAKAVSTATARGAGHEELRCALEVIQKDGLIDEKAVDMITKGKAALPDVCQAVSVFLSQEEAAVNNPSAYITRSINNALKQSQQGAAAYPVMQHGAYGYAMAGPPLHMQRPSLSSHPMMRKLDESARQALESAGFEAASAILAELQSKGQEVRNPSAYVLKSAANARKGIGAAATVGYGYAPAPFSYLPPATRVPVGRNLAGARNGAALDERALAALDELPPDAAVAVWKQYESVQSSVKNPSAYLTRAVENYWKGQGAAAGEPLATSVSGVAPSSVNASANRELIAPWLGSLDETAVSALEGADTQVVAACLADLEAKIDSVRNPSAYVVRSVTNAKRGRQASDDPSRHALEVEMSELSLQLDAKATSALEEIGATAALSIVQNLKQSGGSIGNPSAYVMKSVQNFKQQGGSRPLKRPRLDGGLV